MTRKPSLDKFLNIPILQDMRKRFKATTLVALILTMSLASAVLGLTWTQVTSLMQTNKTISSTGLVKAVDIGIYWDSGLMNRVSSIDWGVLEPDSTKNVTVYIRNEGNAPVSLTMNTSNWNPSNATTYISLTWNYLSQNISVSQTVQVTFTLMVTANIRGISSFSFDIIIACMHT